MLKKIALQTEKLITRTSGTFILLTFVQLPQSQLNVRAHMTRFAMSVDVQEKLVTSSFSHQQW